MRANMEHERIEKSYFHVSKTWSMSLVFILPLVVLYQIGIVQSGSEWRNLAEVWMSGPLVLLGVPATAAVNVLLLCGVVIALWRLRRTGALSLVYSFFMVVESFLYALLLFSSVSIVAHMLDETVRGMLSVVAFREAFDGLPAQQLLLGIGAGVYEELLFRVLMIGGGALILKKVFRCGPFFSLTCMLVISSVVFSAAHHVGGAGEPFSSYVFIFRALCGIVLGIIYIARGPGIPVMTHALYNVMVILIATAR